MSAHPSPPATPATQPLAEFTLKAVAVGVLLGIVFGTANAYLGLRVGGEELKWRRRFLLWKRLGMINLRVGRNLSPFLDLSRNPLREALSLKGFTKGEW